MFEPLEFHLIDKQLCTIRPFFCKTTNDLWCNVSIWSNYEHVTCRIDIHSTHLTWSEALHHASDVAPNSYVLCLEQLRLFITKETFGSIVNYFPNGNICTRMLLMSSKDISHYFHSTESTIGFEFIERMAYYAKQLHLQYLTECVYYYRLTEFTACEYQELEHVFENQHIADIYCTLLQGDFDEFDFTRFQNINSNHTTTTLVKVIKTIEQLVLLEQNDKDYLQQFKVYYPEFKRIFYCTEFDHLWALFDEMLEAVA
jgi:hypothetical protein